MTNPFAVIFDTMAVPLFAGQGLAEMGATYWPPNGSGAYPCNVYVDRASFMSGDQSQVISNRVRVTCFQKDISSIPEIGGSFEVAGETFTIDGVGDSDESRYVMICKAGE